MKKLEVIVLLSIYNGEKFLNKQLESLFKQKTSCNITIYYRDDGSTDKSMDIIESWKKYLSIIECPSSRKQNLGPALSFWELMNTAPDADFYTFCDQDDIWYENKIEKAVRSICDKKDAVLYCSNCNIIDENDKLIKKLYQEQRPILTLEAQLVSGAMQGCAMLFNKKLLNIIKESKISNIPMHDIVIMYIALINGTVIYEHNPLFGYRMHSNNVVAKDNKKFSERLKATYQLWFEDGKKYPIQDMASDLIKNYSNILKDEDMVYLRLLENYKKSIIKKIKIITDKKTQSVNSKGLRSFKIRILLGIL